MRTAEQNDRLDYLRSIYHFRLARVAESIGEHSPCGEMGTAERLARESLTDFESSHLPEIRELATS